MLVPVVDKTGKPLMPTKPSRARRWIKSKEATPFFKKGIFCIRLNRDPYRYPSAEELREAGIEGIE
jgi:hypothetical protein